jgi:hypothetical protein
VFVVTSMFRLDYKILYLTGSLLRGGTSRDLGKYRTG